MLIKCLLQHNRDNVQTLVYKNPSLDRTLYRHVNWPLTDILGLADDYTFTTRLAYNNMETVNTCFMVNLLLLCNVCM